MNEPVLPVTRYCAALELWQSAMRQRAERAREALYPGIHGPYDAAERKAAWEKYDAEKAKSLRDIRNPTERDYAVSKLRDYERVSEQIDFVFLQIRKSCLLDRLIYGGQALRETPCPVHKGRWSGCAWPVDPKDACACIDGSNVTGWLPNEEPKT